MSISHPSAVAPPPPARAPARQGFSPGGARVPAPGDELLAAEVASHSTRTRAARTFRRRHAHAEPCADALLARTEMPPLTRRVAETSAADARCIAVEDFRKHFNDQ